MLSEVEWILAVIKRVLGREERVTAAYLFGSVASGEATPMSDIDVAILLNDSSPDVCLQMTRELTIRISEALGSSRIDVVCLNHADVALRNNVVRRGILFLDRDPMLRAEFERRTWDEYDEMQRIWMMYDRHMVRRFAGRLRRMIDPDMLVSGISITEQALDVLTRVREGGLNAYFASLETRLMAERALHLAIESCIDMAGHLVSARKLGRPTSYVDIFQILRDRGLIDEDLARRMMSMVRFRHRLVHLYSRIDNALVFKLIDEELDDISRFVNAVIDLADMNEG